MSSVLLHVGGSKCGSSALQRFLSDDPVLPMQGNKTLRYVAYYNPLKVLLAGDNITHVARSTLMQYLNAEHLLECCASKKDMMQEFFVKAPRDESCFAFSCEGWVPPQNLLNSTFLNSLPYAVDVLLYVRPQVKFMNSAWWQWGAWTGHSLDAFIEYQVEHQTAAWGHAVRTLQADPAIRNVSVRLLPKDIVSDFIQMMHINTDTTTFREHNKSLSGDVLRLFQHNPALRPDSHGSGIDFSLERRIPSATGSTPWVLNSDHIQKILNIYKEDTLDLLECLPDDQRIILLKDATWWDHDAYTKPVDPVDENPEESSINGVAVKAVSAIGEMDRDMLVKDAYLDAVNAILWSKERVTAAILQSISGEQRELLGILSYRQSLLYKEHGKIQAALQAAGWATRLEARPVYYSLLGNLRIHTEDFTGAIEALEKAVSLDASMVETHLQLSHLYAKIGNTGRAVKKAYAAIALEGDSAEIYHHLSNIRHMSGQLAEAKAAIERALELDSTNAKYHQKLSHILYAMGENTGALQKASDAYEIEKHDSSILHQYGNMLHANGSVAAAIIMQEKAIALDAALPGPHIQLSQLYHGIDDTERAVQHARMAIALDAKNPQLYQHLGNMLQASGDAAGAQRAHETSQALMRQASKRAARRGRGWWRMLMQARGKKGEGGQQQ